MPKAWNRRPGLRLVPNLLRPLPPTEPALSGRFVEPHLLAALAPVHAQCAAGSGIQDFMHQSRRGTTSLTFDRIEFVAHWRVASGHDLAPNWAGACNTLSRRWITRDRAAMGEP